jgi:hypothetical protein
MTAANRMHRSRRSGGLFVLFMVALLPAHAWSSIYECRDQDGRRIITDSPSQLEECKTISTTPSPPKKSGFGGGQSYVDIPTQTPPGAGAPIQYPPVLITGPNGEVISEPDPASGQTAGALPSQKSDAAQTPPAVNQLHPFLPPVAAPQVGTEQKP